MFCHFLEAVRVYVDRTSTKGPEPAIAADISVVFPLLCPACQHVSDYEIVTPGANYGAGCHQGRHSYYLPGFASLWTTMVERIGQVFCHHCGTAGILAAADAVTVLAHLRARYPGPIMVAALESLGFTVDRSASRYENAGVRPLEKLIVQPARP